MDMFLHNRVGTAVSESEYEKGIKSPDGGPPRVPVSNPEAGKMYAYPTGLGTAHVWVIFIELVHGATQYKVKTREDITNNSSAVKSIIIPEGRLFEYQSLEPIEQKYKSTEPKLSEDELLETYRIE